MNTIHVTSTQGVYPIYIAHGALARAGELFPLARKVLVLTDDGVPATYAERIAAQCGTPTLLTLPQGEATKCFASLERILSTMLAAGFTRSDAVVAVGGGVMGDLAGLAAALYMRGVDFYNVPTTLLSQVDSSVGGKTAIDLCGIKNCVGSFYPPKGVLIDPDVLSTLAPRQYAAGMAEVIKMAATLDGELFSALEADSLSTEEMIRRAIACKVRVVEADEKESGLRRVLNFGHTIGHGIESCGALLHGECVALGMLPLSDLPVRERLLALYKRVGLPTCVTGDVDRIVEAMSHDKKRDGARVFIVYCHEIGSFEIRPEEMSSVQARTKEILS